MGDWMMNRTFVLLIVFSLVGYASSSGEHGDVTQAKNIIDQNIPCSQLSDDQLEVIGDYIMELRHPGEEHEFMDNMMGGEGSESLRETHIRMARNIYCDDESVAMGQGMMGGGMMDSGQRSDSLAGTGGMMGPGMIGGYGSDSTWSWIWMGFWLLILIGIVLLIAGLYKNITGRHSRETPLEVLKTRYAKGEISKKEFEAMKEELA